MASTAKNLFFFKNAQRFVAVDTAPATNHMGPMLESIGPI